MKKRLCFPVALLVAAAGVLMAATPAHFAIRGARVFTVSGPVFERGTVLINDGLIEALEGITISTGVNDGDLLEMTNAKMRFIRGSEVDLETWHMRLYKKYMERP